MKYTLRSLMRFSIRDLFWLLTLAAVLTTWWVDRSRLAQEIESQKREQLEEAKQMYKEAVRMAAGAQSLINSLPKSPAPAPNP
jgi:hypothetical protein